MSVFMMCYPSEGKQPGLFPSAGKFAEGSPLRQTLREAFLPYAEASGNGNRDNKIINYSLDVSNEDNEPSQLPQWKAMGIR